MLRAGEGRGEAGPWGAEDELLEGVAVARLKDGDLNQVWWLTL